MKQLIFYTTQGCHLCELAMQVINATLNPEYFEIAEVDISDFDDLVDSYGVRIPVLRDQSTDEELGWPFDQGQLIEFIERVDK